MEIPHLKLMFLCMGFKCRGFKDLCKVSSISIKEKKTRRPTLFSNKTKFNAKKNKQSYKLD